MPENGPFPCFPSIPLATHSTDLYLSIKCKVHSDWTHTKNWQRLAMPERNLLERLGKCKKLLSELAHPPFHTTLTPNFSMCPSKVSVKRYAQKVPFFAPLAAKCPFQYLHQPSQACNKQKQHFLTKLPPPTSLTAGKTIPLSNVTTQKDQKKIKGMVKSDILF